MSANPTAPERPAGDSLGPLSPPVSETSLLTPAALQKLLRSPVFGHRIFYYETLGSTNDRALELAAGGEMEGGLVLAEEQTCGRGRRERTWSSRPRLGIYASLILRPEIAAPRTPLFTFMAAVSVAEALREVAGIEARIKWPNDVRSGVRKIAGILGEFRGGEPKIREMVVGFGVNVNQRSSDFPSDLADRATSVRMERGETFDRAPILAAILEGFERRYARMLRQGPEHLLGEWSGLSAVSPGARVMVEGPGGRSEGLVRGVDEEGALLLEGAGGVPLRVPFGEIVEPI